MFKKHRWVVFSAILLLFILTALYGIDNKQSSATVKTIDKQNIISKKLTLEKSRLVEKLNHSPEYANLTAREKVKIIVKEMRKEQPSSSIKNKIKTKLRQKHGIQIENRIKIKQR